VLKVIAPGRYTCTPALIARDLLCNSFSTRAFKATIPNFCVAGILDTGITFKNLALKDTNAVSSISRHE